MLNNKFISSILDLNKLKIKISIFPLIILLFFSCSVEKKELKIQKKNEDQRIKAENREKRKEILKEKSWFRST